MRKIRWLIPEKYDSLHSITEFACQYAGTMQCLQLETRQQESSKIERLVIGADGNARAARFDLSLSRRRPQEEAVTSIGPAAAAEIFAAVASFLAGRNTAFATGGAGMWDIFVVDGSGRVFTGSGATAGDSASANASAAIRERIPVGFMLFDGGA